MNGQRTSYLVPIVLCIVFLLGTTPSTTDCTGIVGGGGSATLRVENHSPYTMTALYISPSNMTTWGSNWLTYALTGNAYVEFSITPGTYDIRAHWDEFNGTNQEEYGLVFNAGESYVWAAYLKSAEDGGMTESALKATSGWAGCCRWMRGLAGF